MIQAAPHSVTAFIGQQRLASGPLAEVALAVMKASRSTAEKTILIFINLTGRRPHYQIFDKSFRLSSKEKPWV